METPSGQLVDKATKGTVKDFYETYSVGPYASGKVPDSDMDVILDMFLKDPEVNAAVSVRINAIMSSGYTYEGKSKETDAKKLDELGFNRELIRRIVSNFILYQNVFIEIVRDGEGNATEVNLLETTQMEIVADKHGTIEKYLQRSSEGKVIEFPAEDVIYIPASRMTTKVWGDVYMKSLYRTVITKNNLEKFINYLSETNQWRNMIRSSEMTDDDLKSMLSYYRRATQDPNMPFVFKGGKDSFEITPMRNVQELEYFINMLNYLRSKVFMSLKVPPIVMGVTDNSNRSNSDDQLKTFHMTNQSDRETLQDAINNKLFKSINIDSKFSWNPIDKRTEKEDVEMAEKLINMGAKKEQVEKFLRLTGLELPEGELFDKDMEPTKSMDQFPSRQGSNGQHINKIGVGSESSTRQDQLVSKSFDRYPYTMN